MINPSWSNMLEIIPNTYMLIRVKSLIDFINSISVEKRNSFTLQELNIFKTKNEDFFKKRFASYLCKIDFLIKLNGHYKVNEDNEAIKKLFDGIHNNNKIIISDNLKIILRRYEEITKLLATHEQHGKITIQIAKNYFQTQYNINFHREQIKYLFGLLEMAGYGNYLPFDGEFVFGKNRTILRAEHLNPRLRMTMTVEIDGKIIKKIVEEDEEKIFEILSKEDLITLYKIRKY